MIWTLLPSPRAEINSKVPMHRRPQDHEDPTVFPVAASPSKFTVYFESWKADVLSGPSGHLGLSRSDSRIRVPVASSSVGTGGCGP